MKEGIAFLLCAFVLFGSGCSTQMERGSYPTYFEPIIQRVEECREAERDLSTALGGRDHHKEGSGRYEDKKYTCYIEGESYLFDLSAQLQDTEEWQWLMAGIVQGADQNRTYVLLHDFNIAIDAEGGGMREPQLLLLDFDVEDATDCEITPFTVEPPTLFGWAPNAYGVGDYIYFSNIPTNTILAELNPVTKQIRYCQEEYDFAEKCVKENFEEPYQMVFFGADLEQDGVYVYSACVSESNDMPPVGMVAVAYENDQALAYMIVDLRKEAGDDIMIKEQKK